MRRRSTPRIQNCRDIKPNFSKSTDNFRSKNNMPASRFKIVPVESRYKRGRWECFDYYEKDSIAAKNAKLSNPGPSPLTANSVQSERGSRSLVEMTPQPLTAPPVNNVKFSFDYCGTDVENIQPVTDKVAEKQVSKIPQPLPPVNNNGNNATFSYVDHMSPTKILQNGLETTLMTSDSQIANDSNTSSNNNGTSPAAMVAIDSKIEQAMDLVKTHLMFAVREEVEVLRTKIVDLETHIHHLETENSVLKDHIPEDILKNLNLGVSK